MPAGYVRHGVRWATLGAAMLALLATQARAQNEAPQGPCDRGGSAMQMGGMDMDVLRCQMALSTQRIAKLSADLDQTLATLALAQVDLRKAHEAAAKREADLKMWFEGWFGAPQVDPKPKP